MARPRRPERPPAAVFIGAGYREVERLLRAADAELMNVSGDASRPSARERVLFCAEPDVHTGSLRAWMLPSERSAAGTTEDFTAREVRLPGRS